MDFYFDKQLHEVDLTLCAQNNRIFFLNGLKMHYEIILVYPTIFFTNKVSYSNIFLACST